MMRGMDAAISGLTAQQTLLDTTANNLANANTIGYKAQSTQFVDELSQTIVGANGASGQLGGTGALQVGLGVQVGSIENEMSSGSMESTGNPLDVAIAGDGFLQVDTGDPTATTGATAIPNGNVEYTRAGNLQINSQGYLTTQSGEYVLGVAATPVTPATTPPTYQPADNNAGATSTTINVPPGSTDVAIGKDGAVTYTDQTAGSPNYGQTVTAGYVQLATFSNPAGLTRAGGSMWEQSANSGAPVKNIAGNNGAGSLASGELEGSNVDMATEFSNMIDAQNSYEADSKVITTADQMLQSLVQMAG
jgi:flagellar hook protein FlgE